jgi:glycosyltransferase involved in cell wall biosynthesis
MLENTLLSIVIPTYNRAALLDYSLSIHVPLAKVYNIAIFISDNASTDATKEIVSKWAKQYSLVRFFTNSKNIGPEANFECALKYPNTEYVWLLGDSYQIPSDGILYTINLLTNISQRYDAVVLNLAGRLDGIPAQEFTDSNNLLSSLGAIMTCLSCLIYSKELIKNSNFERYKDSYFMQTGIIFEAIARRSFRIHWAQSISVNSLPHCFVEKKCWWDTSDVFEIGCKKWVNFVFSLPVSYSLDNKMKCILNFTKVSKLFSIYHLLNLRIENILNYKVYKEYSSCLSLTIGYPKLLIIVIVCVPRHASQLLKTINNVRKWISTKKALVALRKITNNKLS